MPRRVLLACLLVVVWLVAGCGGSTASGGDEPASGVPRDAAMYFEATVRPEGSQRDDALAAAGKVLATPDPQTKIEALVQKALSQSDGLKLDYTRDIKPWLGSKAGFWLAAPRSRQELRGAAVLSSTDSDAAQAAVDRAVRGSGKTFTMRSYKGVDYQVNEEDGAAVVAGDWVVLGSEVELQRTLETLDGGKPLADEDRYRNAVGPLDSARLGTVYLDVRALVDAASGSDAQVQQFRRVFPVDALGPVAAAFLANGDRLAVDAAVPGARDYAERFGALSGTGSTPLLGELPADAWAALGAPKLGQSAKAIYQQLAGALGGAAIEQQLRSQLGLDLEQDVFSWIGDVAFFARGTSKDAVEGAAVIEVTDEERAKAAFGKLVGLAQTRGGARAKPVALPGAESGFEFSYPGSPQPIVAALGKGRAVIASGTAAAADALSPKDKLADSATWGEAKSLLGDGLEPSFLLSMPAVVSLAQSTSGGDPDFEQARPYLEAFSLIASGGNLDGDTARSRIVAALK